MIVQAYAIWDKDNNEYYPPKKSGVPKIWSLESQVKRVITEAKRATVWRQKFWDDHPHYRHNEARPADLNLEIVTVEIKKI